MADESPETHLSVNTHTRAQEEPFRHPSHAYNTQSSLHSATLPPDSSVDSEKGREDDGPRSPASTIQGNEEAPQNPLLVDWDGPDDPEKPANWPHSRRYSIIAIISTISFLTPLASSMFAPGVPQLMTEFGSDNLELASFVVSVFILGYAFGPVFIAPASELYGRLVTYHVCNTLFVVFNIACAVSTNLNMLIAFRFFAGLFGSCPLTIGGGTVADMIVQEKRGGE
ncbi:MAG: hypothetical protein Q9193_006097 [Seirophora villosa]